MRTSDQRGGNISRIPQNTPPDRYTTERKVQVGFRPVGGRATAWTIGVVHSLFRRGAQHLLAEQDLRPDPHYHWCVLVGDYYHQMQVTDGLVWYDNDKSSWKEGWSVIDVGISKFNDIAIADAAVRTIMDMPKSYDMWTNNCHHFVLQLLDHICTTSDHRQKLVQNYYRHPRLSIILDITERTEPSIELDRLSLVENTHPLDKHVVKNHNQNTIPTEEDTASEYTPCVTPDELETADTA